MATVTLTPYDAHTAAAMLAHASEEQQPVVPCGHRTRLGAAAASDTAIPISSSLLTRGLDHQAGDLVAMLPAGATLRDVNAALGAEGQWLPLDPQSADRTTIGGLVATNDSGPRRHRYGTPRDLIIGIEVALASGRVVHAGGRVVKNVAGYDLSRLFCGSHGSLGMITSAIFKLAPIPPTSRTVVARVARLQDAAQLALDLGASHLTPSCIELSAPEPTLLVRFESTARAAERMASAAATLLAAGHAQVTALDAADEAAAWRAHEATNRSDTIATITVLPTALGPLLAQFEQQAAERALAWRLTAHAAIGIAHVHVGGEPAQQADAVAMLRTLVHARRGHVRLTQAAATARDTFPAWDPLGSAASAAAAVKQRFDPAGVLPWPWSERSDHG